MGSAIIYKIKKINMKKNKSKIIAICGMAGSGKSVVADYFVAQGYQFLRFGQVTLDVIIEQDKKPSEKLERQVRESLRKKHGMGAFAKFIIPKVEKLKKNGPVILDGLYSWDEYKILKNKYKDNLVLIAVWAPPELRYKRISQRKSGKKDKKLRHRPFTIKEAKSRDYAELANLDKGGPIAMADYTITNENTMKTFKEKIRKTFKQVNSL